MQPQQKMISLSERLKELWRKVSFFTGFHQQVCWGNSNPQPQASKRCTQALSSSEIITFTNIAGLKIKIIGMSEFAFIVKNSQVSYGNLAVVLAKLNAKGQK